MNVGSLIARALILTVATAVATAAQQAAAPSTASAPPGYSLVWADEFADSGSPDPRNWTYERGFVRNQEQQWYQPENAVVKDGQLVIEARKEARPNPQFVAGSTDWRRNRETSEYTSASLSTRGLHSFRYGRFEMRARIDIRSGMWPAFWTLGEAGRWPANGEIDIMEFYRGNLLANVAWADSTGKAVWDDTRTPVAGLGGATWASRFHVWRMDWDENEVRLYVDDTLLNTTDVRSAANGGGGLRNPLQQPHYIIVNLAIGGANGGDPSITTFPARFEIDYVRVYQKAAIK
jgi:beta-glucanase (GH16 family)